MLSVEFNKQSKDAFLKYIENLRDEIADFVRAEVEDSMLKIEQKAAQEVRVDTGNLKNSIQSRPIKVTKKEITGGVEVGAEYGPYVEFGTGTAIKIPSELTQFASEFKGDGIKQVNLPARPFFYPEVFNQRKELPDRIDKTLTTLFKRNQ
jgi:HK97 gp10 family phage protein